MPWTHKHRCQHEQCPNRATHIIRANVLLQHYEVMKERTAPRYCVSCAIARAAYSTKVIDVSGWWKPVTHDAG